jgi:hypothetical protein
VKTPYSLKFASSAVLASAFVLSQASLSAELLVYEGFNYGLTNNATMHSVVSNSTGTQGSWTVTNVNGGQSRFQTAGLAFGNDFAASTGGSLLVSNLYNNSASSTIATVKLNTSATGTVWASYLANYTTISNSNNGFIEQGIGTSATARATQFLNRVSSNSLPSDRKVVAGYDTTGTASPNTAIGTGVTYLILSKYTNVGTPLSSGAGSGVATTWVLDQAGYANWISLGLGLEANLDNYDIRKVQDTAVTTGQFDLNSDKYLTIAASANNINNHQFTGLVDEFRYGTDLTSVISSIPEPSTYVMIAGAAALAGAVVVRRRRATRA